MVKVLIQLIELLSNLHSRVWFTVETFVFKRKLRYELWVSRKPKLGGRSIRITPLMLGSYPDVPFWGIIFTIRLTESMDTGRPPTLKVASAGTIPLILIVMLFFGIIILVITHSQS